MSLRVVSDRMRPQAMRDFGYPQAPAPFLSQASALLHGGVMDERRIAEFAMQAYGVVALADAPALNVSSEALRSYLRRRRWDFPYPGIAVRPGTEPSFEQAAMIALKAARQRRVALARLSAAYVAGIVSEHPNTIDLIVPMNRNRPAVAELDLRVTERARTRTVAVRFVRSRTLMTSHVTTIRNLQVTTPARTLIDLAAISSVSRLRDLVIDARQRRLVTLGELSAVHASIACYPGRAKISRILADLDEDDCDSTLEWDFRKAARRRRFAPFSEPFPFTCRDGVTIEIDVAFPDEWVAVECHGLGAHSQRSDLVRQNLRQNMAVASGWRPFVVDWTRLHQNPDELFAELAALLASPHPHAGPAQAADPAAVDRRYRGRRRRGEGG
jgi:hypothetical protein